MRQVELDLPFPVKTRWILEHGVALQWLRDWGLVPTRPRSFACSPGSRLSRDPSFQIPNSM